MEQEIVFSNENLKQDFISPQPLSFYLLVTIFLKFFSKKPKSIRSIYKCISIRKEKNFVKKYFSMYKIEENEHSTIDKILKRFLSPHSGGVAQKTQ